ncbi:sensor histidine kinase [Edaphobacillus lindanitolerans]|uniref:histidine kinase n=1 Tax=Edaphobacillus lindanitolerans TaxID=550447 RepID=A0A1U7PLA0_9BACI|nr:sensor histidine kinase [Edaphobacillus lindanitolerans]SIT74520.1 two-component system, OmpR family, bacitracin resistance sensor histidine kinase BceS [Edaphobacillus lindanitolerans]
MFIPYIRSRIPWILFYLAALFLADLLIYLDSGLPVDFSAAVYFNVLLLAALVLFIVWRFRRETKFLSEIRSLEGEPLSDWEALLPVRPVGLDCVTMELLQEVSRTHRKEKAALQEDQTMEADYTAAWVHEVKAPLTAMKLILDEHRGQPAMRRLSAEWLRLHLLIDRQLYISRLPTIASDFIPETADIQSLIAPEVRDLAAWCMEKDVAVELEGEDVPVRSDVKWARFVIRQVLTNAVKYSPAGGTIRIWTGHDESGHPNIRIEDEGPGIPAHDLFRIFEKGFTGGTGRIHNAATGLGLYLADTVGARLGMGLCAVSEEGSGTAVTVVFPRENEFDRMMEIN